MKCSGSAAGRPQLALGVHGGDGDAELLDLLDDEEFALRRQALLEDLGWDGPVFAVSSVSRRGLDELVGALAIRLDELRADDPVLGGDAAETDDEPYDPLKK